MNKEDLLQIRCHIESEFLHYNCKIFESKKHGDIELNEEDYLKNSLFKYLLFKIDEDLKKFDENSRVND